MKTIETIKIIPLCLKSDTIEGIKIEILIDKAKKQIINVTYSMTQL